MAYALSTSTLQKLKTQLIAYACDKGYFSYFGTCEYKNGKYYINCDGELFVLSASQLQKDWDNLRVEQKQDILEDFRKEYLLWLYARFGKL